MMPKGKTSSTPKLSQSHIRFSKSPGDKSPGDKESLNEISEEEPVLFRNTDQLAEAERQSLWRIPADPRSFHLEPKVVEQVPVGPMFTMKIEEEGLIK